MSFNLPDDTPENVRAVVAAAARLTGIPEDEFFVRDHEHEQLSPGAFSIAFEGWVDPDPKRSTEWPYLVSQSQHVTPDPYPGLFLEPLSHWGLAVYPA